MPESTILVEGEDGSTKVTIRFAVFTFPTDALAKAAWEKGHAKAKGGVSIWRLKEPLHPPHRHHIVVVCCEDPRHLRTNARVIKAMPGASNHELPQDMLDALAMRRVNNALDSLSKVGGIDGSKRLGVHGRTVIRTPAGRVMHRDGTMEPFERPQG